MMDSSKVEQAVRMMLEAFGENPDREGLRDTPKRVAGYWKELLEGMNYTNEEIASKYGKRFIVPTQSMVVKQVNDLYSHCEHHLALMYNMTATIAYIPKHVDGGYQVIGLSKIPRIAEMCAKRLQLQEKLANDIAECISIATESEDVYVNIVADHACVSARGAKSDGRTDVTAVRGRFQYDNWLYEMVDNKARRIRGD